MNNSCYFNKHYLHLIKEFSIAKYKLKDQRSFLGFLWSFLSPFVMTNVLFFLFKSRMGLECDMKFFLYILIGTVTWNFFVVATSLGIASISSRGTMVKNVGFPKEILIFSDMGVFTFQYLFELLVIFFFILLSGVGLSVYIIFLPIIIVTELLFITGITLFLSCAYIIYARDLGYVWNMITRVLFFLVPIFYPLSIVPERFKWFVFLNPMTQIIIFSRDVLLYQKIPSITSLIAVFSFCMLFFLLGYRFFKFNEFRMVESV